MGRSPVFVFFLYLSLTLSWTALCSPAQLKHLGLIFIFIFMVTATSFTSSCLCMTSAAAQFGNKFPGFCVSCQALSCTLVAMLTLVSFNVPPVNVLFQLRFCVRPSRLASPNSLAYFTVPTCVLVILVTFSYLSVDLFT